MALSDFFPQYWFIFIKQLSKSLGCQSRCETQKQGFHGTLLEAEGLKAFIQL